MRTEPFFESHPVVLTQTELDERAHEAAGVGLQVEIAAHAVEAHVEAAKDKKKALEAEQKALESRLFELGRAVKSRREPRQVECRELLNGHKVETIREDTGEMVSSRAASRAEIEEYQQAPLFPGGGTTTTKKRGKAAPQSTAPEEPGPH